MSYNAYLVETVTGQVGARLSVVGKPTWSIPLNGIESGTVRVLISDLKGIERIRFQPWWGSVLLTYLNSFGQEIPVVAGPIQSWPEVNKETISMNFKGIRAIFERRNVINPDDPLDKRKDIIYTGLSLGTIAQEVVAVSLRGPGGSLPITYATPRETATDDADHQRTYPWWNLANQGTHDVLSKITEVIDGPDIMFRPTWKDDSHQYIVWEMHNGTESQQKIAQYNTADFDTTSDDSGVVDFGLLSDGSDLVSKVWGTGAGEGNGTVIRYRQNLALVDKGYPRLEKTFSESEITNDKIHLLNKYADAYLNAGQKMTDQLSLTVLMDHRKNPFGSWYVGNDISVTVDDYPVLPSGTYLMRVLQASGGEGNITLELQEISV